MATDSQTAKYIQTTALSTGRRRLSWTTLSSSTVRVFPLNARSGGLVVAALAGTGVATVPTAARFP